MAIDCGVGRDYQHVSAARCGARGRRSGLDHSEDRHGNRRLDCIEGQGAGGVAGDYQKLGALFAHQELRALDGIAGDGAPRLGAVGQAGGVAEKGKPRVGKTANQGAQHREAAEAGVEDADGGCGGRGGAHGWGTSVETASVAAASDTK